MLAPSNEVPARFVPVKSALMNVAPETPPDAPNDTSVPRFMPANDELDIDAPPSGDGTLNGANVAPANEAVSPAKVTPLKSAPRNTVPRTAMESFHVAPVRTGAANTLSPR